MQSSVKIDILNPKAFKLLKNLADLKLISIQKEDSDNGFRELLKQLRSNADAAPSLKEITKEVEEVRAKRYEKK